jgi:hypothetical protein
MRFLLSEWDAFCRRLRESGVSSKRADTLLKEPVERFVVLKHDVETSPKKALAMAKIESEYGHEASYYVQAYLLENPQNVQILSEIASLGHEVSYHYDVLDFCGGDMECARREFEKNLKLFEKYGFDIVTVCQHGNPTVERKGYSSNRDFFRDSTISHGYDICDIMVNYRERAGLDYAYVSDSGYGWHLIENPEMDDLEPGERIDLDGMEGLMALIEKRNVIVSSHPHRWHSGLFEATMRRAIFESVRYAAIAARRIPLFRRVMSRYYHLAKKL